MYYGEEIQLVGKRKDGDNSDVRRRLPMIWSKDDKKGECAFPEKNRPGLNNTVQVEEGVNDKLKDGYSLVNHYKKAINVRNKYPFLKNGIFTSMMDEVDAFTPWIIMYKVSLGDQYIIVVHNFSEEAVETTVPGKEIVNSIDTSKVAPTLKDGKLSLGAYSTAILV